MDKRFTVMLSYEAYEEINNTLAGQVRYEEASFYNDDTNKLEIIAELPCKKSVSLLVGLDPTTDDVSARISLLNENRNPVTSLWDNTYLPWQVNGDERFFEVPFKCEGKEYEVTYRTKVGQQKSIILTKSGKESRSITLYGPEWLP